MSIEGEAARKNLTQPAHNGSIIPMNTRDRQNINEVAKIAALVPAA